jgi:hypothetical protein
VERILQFCVDRLEEFRDEQQAIERVGGIRYPLMKLVDMYFWQTGFELDQPNRGPASVDLGTG